jgi:hypothetical protein
MQRGGSIPPAGSDESARDSRASLPCEERIRPLRLRTPGLGDVGRELPVVLQGAYEFAHC